MKEFQFLNTDVFRISLSELLKPWYVILASKIGSNISSINKSEKKWNCTASKVKIRTAVITYWYFMYLSHEVGVITFMRLFSTHTFLYELMLYGEELSHNYQLYQIYLLHLPARFHWAQRFVPNRRRIGFAKLEPCRLAKRKISLTNVWNKGVTWIYSFWCGFLFDVNF